MVEEISEQCIADDNCKSIHDLLDSRIIDGEITDYKKILVAEKILVTEKEKILNLQKPIVNDNDETNGKLLIN